MAVCKNDWCIEEFGLEYVMLGGLGVGMNREIKGLHSYLKSISFQEAFSGIDKSS